MNGKRIMIEGGVIVISILLAFGIDAMWEERKERIEEQEILTALKTEFETNLAEITTVMEAHNRARITVDEMVRATDEEIIASSQQRRSEYVMSMCNPWSFYPIIGTTDALIGAGELGILEDRRLRGALTTFMFLVEDSIEDIGYVGKDAERVWVAEIDAGGPWTDRDTEINTSGNVVMAPLYLPKASAEDILSIRSDEQLLGLIGRCHINIGYYLAELVRLRTGAERVLELIAESDLEAESNPGG